MKFLKNIVPLVLLCSMYSVNPRALSKGTPTTVAQPKPVMPPVAQQPQSYAQALNTIRKNMSPANVIAHNAFTQEFVTFVTSLNLSDVETRALLEAGANIHAVWTDTNEANKQLLTSLRNTIASIMQSRARVQPQPVEPVPKKPIVLMKPKLEQLEIYSQSNVDGGGPASCGYHALLRSMQTVSAVSKNENMNELKKTLMDPEIIQLYFGEKGSCFDENDCLEEDGIWRNEIIKKRTMSELKKFLHENFVSALKKENLTEKEVELYKSALGFLEDNLIAISKNPEMIKLPYSFVDDDIRETIKNGLLKIQASAISEQSLAIIDELEKPEKIDMSFDYEKIRKTVLSQNYIANLPALLTRIENDPKLKSEFKGEWLDDGELELIWKNHWSDIIPPQVSCGFKTIATFDFIGREGFEAVDEFTPYVKENIQPDLNKNKQLFQVFALGTMRQTGEREGTRGHWYALVMHQNKQGKRNYYVMDSAQNTSRLQDENVWKLINVIENK